MQLSYSDPERTALAYLLALNEDCYTHINDLYDFEERVIIAEGLNQEQAIKLRYPEYTEEN